MSANTVETFLYRLGNDRELQELFALNEHAALDRYPLAAEERRQINQWDLHAIIDSGVNPMVLAFGYMIAHGGLQAQPEYMRLLKEPKRKMAGIE